jgi:hypothetical protein
VPHTTPTSDNVSQKRPSGRFSPVFTERLYLASPEPYTHGEQKQTVQKSAAENSAHKVAVGTASMAGFSFLRVRPFIRLGLQ